MDILQVLRRARRKAGWIVARRRDRAATADVDLQPVTIRGRWMWPHPHPRRFRDELRAEHLDIVVEVLRDVGVAPFVVPSADGLHAQVGVTGEDRAIALEALGTALTGRAWYVAWGEPEDPQEQLIGRRSLPDAPAMTLFPRYQAAGSPLVTGPELGVEVVVWERDGDRYVAGAPNDELEWLRPQDLEPGEIVAHGRTWPSLAVLERPHADDTGALTWLVVVPAWLRRDHPRLADLLARSSVRSLWFHTAAGTRVQVLDEGTAGWSDHPQAPTVVAPRHPDDPTRSLVAAWRAAAGPLVVLPAGGLVLRDLAASRLVTAGGVGLFRHDAVRLDQRPPQEATPKLRETLALQRWFAERTGTTMPWGLSALPQGLPPLDRLPVGELEALLDDPARPPMGRAAVEAHLPVWWSYLQGGAVPGSLRIVRLRAGTQRYVRTIERLVSGRIDVDAASIDADSLVEVPEAVADYERLLAARLPIAAPWE